MKKLSCFALLTLLFGCSADNEDLGVSENEIQTLELQTNIFASANISMEEGYCGTATYPFGNYGDLEVKHDGFDLILTITARDGYELVDTKLHLGSGETAFPLVGQGNLPPGQMDHKYAFEAGTKSFAFDNFDIADDLWGRYVSIATKTTFSNGTSTFSSWAGTEKGKSGNWFYLNYLIQTCCEMANAGSDKSMEITQAYYESEIRYGAKLRRYFLHHFVEEGVVESGSFVPTAGYLDQMYNDWSGQGGSDDNVDIHTDEAGRLIMETTYILGEDYCADEAVYTLYIVPTTTTSL